jgi:hypothetical protein
LHSEGFSLAGAFAFHQFQGPFEGPATTIAKPEMLYPESHYRKVDVTIRERGNLAQTSLGYPSVVVP